MKRRSWWLVAALGVVWAGACVKRGKSSVSAPGDSGGSTGEGGSHTDSGGPTGTADSAPPRDSASPTDSSEPSETGEPVEPVERVLGDLEAELIRAGERAGGELGGKVVWVNGEAWASEPGERGFVHRLPDGQTISANDPDAHLGVALAGYGDGLLAGAWSREGADDETGAVYLLSVGEADQVVETDIEPALVLEDGVVGIVLLGMGVGEHPDGWLLGQQRYDRDRGRVSLRSKSDHSLIAEWRGVDTGSFSGGSVAAADLDGDGLKDLAMGGWGSDSFAGRVDAFLAPFSSSTTVDDADAVWSGETWGLTGYTLAAGDVTGDGLDDLVVGSFGDTRNGSGAGSFTVVPGGTESGPLFALDGYRLGDGPDAHLSAALVVADLDGDGFADVGAGAPDGATGGVARLYYGPVEGGGTVWDAQVVDVDGARGDGLGASLALDPTHGWLVGAPGASERQGRVLFVETTLPPPG